MRQYPNIVFITIDCLRADALSCYGYRRPTTPTIDKMSCTGLKMENVYAQGSSTPVSFPSIIWGVMPLTGMTYGLSKNKSLTEVLKESGYNTCAFQSNSWLGRQMGYANGFDYFEEFYNLIEDLESRLEYEIKSTVSLKNLKSAEEIETHLTDVFKDYFDKSILSLKNKIPSADNLEKIKELRTEKDLFSSDPLAYIRSRMDSFEKKFCSGSSTAKKLLPAWVRSKVKRLYRFSRGSNSVNWLKKPYADAETLTKKAACWLKDISESSPFFLWIHYMDAHKPYLPGSDYRWPLEMNNYLSQIGVKPISIDDADNQKSNVVRELYDAGIRYLDENINLLLIELEKIKRETLIVITSDHGEEFFEHGDNNHMAKLYDQLIKVPVVMSFVHDTKMMPKIDNRLLASHLDLGTSMLNLCGINKHLGAGRNWFDPGYNRKAVLSESLEDIQQIALGKRYHVPISISVKDGKVVLSARSIDYKVIYSEHDDKFVGFNLREDPEEQKPVYAPDFDDKFVGLQEILKQRLIEIETARNDLKQKPYDIEEKTRVYEQLRALGYIMD